jgi:hypothetical protein
LASFGSTAQEADLILPDVRTDADPKLDSKLVYRLDLMTGKLAAIDRGDLKVGYIYYHYSARQKGWVWSYYQENKTFWYAFGENTTQEAWCFDLRASEEDLIKRLQEFPKLALSLVRQNHRVCVRLQADGRWKVVQSGITPSIYNAETGERWEMSVKNKYIPTVHTHGRSWTVRHGGYYPSGS